LNTRRPNEATVHTPPDDQLTTQARVETLTNNTDQTYQELIETGRAFPYRQSHTFKVVLEEYSGNPFTMLE